MMKYFYMKRVVFGFSFSIWLDKLTWFLWVCELKSKSKKNPLHSRQSFHFHCARGNNIHNKLGNLHLAPILNSYYIWTSNISWGNVIISKETLILNYRWKGVVKEVMLFSVIKTKIIGTVHIFRLVRQILPRKEAFITAKIWFFRQ